MADKLRVHSLAKELGVPSKVVIEKCRAEGIELKNHMAAISVGLAESIREWFSAGEDVTSVEVSDRVDVSGLRKPTREQQEGADQATGGTETATEVAEAEPATAEQQTQFAGPEEIAEADAEAPSPPPVETAAREEQAQPSAAEVTAAAEAPPEEAAGTEEEPAPAPEPTAEPEPATEAASPAVEEPMASEPSEAPVAAEGDESAATEEKPEELEEPEEPDKAVGPAGPQVVPAPAELKGPRVVRIEEPERLRPPRPRPRPAARAPSEPVPAPTSAPPKRGKGKGRKGAEEDQSPSRTRSPRRHSTKADVEQREREWRDQDLLERKERLASVTGHGLRDRRAAERRRQASSGTSVTSQRKEPVTITTPITAKDFCAAVGVPFIVVSKKLMEHTGRLWTINQTLDYELAELIALDVGAQVQLAKEKTAYEKLQEEFAERERKNLKPRPPVVAMLGHVDHGKTSLLDAIRKTSVVTGEAGGITQHIGAYRIKREDWDVTFVDTPGHKAFTEMRARGADLTDVVVLVIAADDGVMPQTEEAIAHAKAAKVAIVVALNKIDLPGVDLNRVYAQLAEHELTPAEWGGETDVIKTSATSGEGIDELVTHLSTLSELLELQSDATVPAQGIVIEAQMREGRGVVAQVLVKEGKLKPGKTVVCGPGSGRIRALRDDRGKQIKEAGPGTPVEVSGLDELPGAGDRLYEVKNLSAAKSIAEEVREQRRREALEATAKPKSLADLMRGEADSELPELNVILRGDVQGSIEVLKQSLREIPDEKAKLKILHTGVGAVSEADVQLAKASGALIIGFHVVPEERARQMAEQLGVEIRTYQVIYELLDDLQKALAGLLAPVEEEEIRGAAEVQQVFNVSRIGTIAGCRVTDGTVHRNHRVRLVRDGRVVVEGRGIGSLKRFKDDAREVRAGLECGIKIEGFDDVKPGDVIQTYELVEVAQEL